MQNPNSFDRNYPSWALQSSVSSQWPARQLPQRPRGGGMEIGGLLNVRQQAAADSHLRLHHHSMQMDPNSYNLSQAHPPAMTHQPQHQSHNPNSMHYSSLQQQHSAEQMYTNNYNAHQQNQEVVDDDFGTPRTKGDSAAKAFACSTCQKKFARRSDLARHGKSAYVPDCRSIADHA